MVYAEGNPRSKKELRDRVAAWQVYEKWRVAQSNPEPDLLTIGAVLDAKMQPPRAVAPIYVYQPNDMFGWKPRAGEISIEGPHYPRAHTWWARVEIDNEGKILRVIS